MVESKCWRYDCKHTKACHTGKQGQCQFCRCHKFIEVTGPLKSTLQTIERVYNTIMEPYKNG